MNPKARLCLALVVVGGWLGVFQTAQADGLPTDTEPRYLNKSLSEWIPLARRQGELFVPVDGRAETAVRQIGTNAIPWLLQWLRSPNPETAQFGIEGLGLLGPYAKAGVPELCQMCRAGLTTTWSNTIPALAAVRDTNGVPYALPFLVTLATDPVVPAALRARTVQSVVEIGYNDSTHRLFIQCLQDRDWRIAQAAAHGLGRMPMEPRSTVPALAACLASRRHEPEDAAVRDFAAWALRDFAELIYYPSSRSESELDDLRQAMSTAIPALVNALADENWSVARYAAEALGEAGLEPDVVVPALVKSLNYRHAATGRYVRGAAVDALGEFGAAAQAAVPALSEMAQSDPWAADALKKIRQDGQDYAGLPDLARFRTNRSDRFLVDIEYLSAGHPFKGSRSVQPHQGAHLHWDNSRNAWPKGGTTVSNYPAIYAVVDGYVDRIDYSFKVGTNDRYGVSLAFARSKTTVYSFCYGIEPMIPEPAPGFYRRYILVSQGQRVKKGDVLAYMYLPPGAGIGSHIHFHIQARNGGAFLAPAIFPEKVVEDFHAHWNGFGRDGTAAMPACMGYLLDAVENPFESRAIDVLK